MYNEDQLETAAKVFELSSMTNGDQLKTAAKPSELSSIYHALMGM